MKSDKLENLIVLFNQLRASLICAYENNEIENFNLIANNCDYVEAQINNKGFLIHFDISTNKYDIKEVETIETIKEYAIVYNKNKDKNANCKIENDQNTFGHNFNHFKVA